MYKLAIFRALMICGSKDIFKNATCLMTNIHHDVTAVVNHEMVKNTKT